MWWTRRTCSIVINFVIITTIIWLTKCVRILRSSVWLASDTASSVWSIYLSLSCTWNDNCINAVLPHCIYLLTKWAVEALATKCDDLIVSTYVCTTLCILIECSLIWLAVNAAFGSTIVGIDLSIITVDLLLTLTTSWIWLGK